VNPEPFRISYKVRASLVCGVVAALSFIARNFHLDDALIYARYISHALQGRGLEFNPGEPVNALTSILSTWLVLALSWVLHHNVLLAEAILSAVFLAAAALLAERIVPLSGLLFASLGVIYYCIGMETSLFVFLLALTIYAYATDRLNWLPTLCVLAALARFEGAALVLVIGWRLWKQNRHPKLSSFAPAVLLIVFYFAFNVFFYHVLLPQSATAKFGQGFSGYWGRWPIAFLRLPETVFKPFGKSYVLALALLVFAAFGLKDRRLSKWNEVLVPFLVILGAFYLLFNIPSYHWYYPPILFFLLIYAICLVPQTRAAQAAALFLILCTAGATASDLRKNAYENLPYRDLALWMNANTPSNARIASVETGTLGWYSDRYFIDLVGLTTPINARYTAHREFSAWLAERPDYVVVHPDNPFPWEKAALDSPDFEFAPVHFGQVYLLRRKTPNIQGTTSALPSDRQPAQPSSSAPAH
jgi:arabinofuranosyltransferase